jgi:WD40 repeat protein/tetratricopeptide (TPR) repeat protein
MLTAFALGDLPEPALSEVAGHLDACTECETRASRLDGASDVVVDGLRCIRACGEGTVSAETEMFGYGKAATVPPTTEAWGDFRIVREIGRGGMGVVCEAYQGSLNRHVAVKFLPERGDLARFRREAKAAGRLHHTNIVPVFGVGEHQGRPYYVMQYIAGRGLDVVLNERTKAGRPLGDREAARLGLQAAEALAYAHAQGVTHRDIKPSNLLLDEQGTVWVADFGLAHDASDTESLTHTGDFLGTLRYVAPERLAGRGDARADIYGLGVTLYELVCGRPAYADADRAALAQRLLNHDPQQPRHVDPHIARDLETILLKAIARDPAHRYATAGALAEDLRRFLEDRPILARRASLLGRAVRWCRRNKLVASLLAALVLVFLAGFALVTVQWRRADAEARRANTLAKSEVEARTAESALRIKAQAEVAERDFDRALELARKGDVDHGLLWMAEVLREAPAERPEFLRMVRTNLVGWQGQVFRRRAIFESRASVDFARFRPDGRVILIRSNDQVTQFWDTATGRPLGPPLERRGLVACQAFSLDGRLCALGYGDGEVWFWDPNTGQHVGPIIDHGRKPQALFSISWLSFSPEGNLLVTSDPADGAKLWEVASGRRLGLPKEAGTCGRAAFSPDGRRMLLLGRDGKGVRIWDRVSGQVVGPNPVTEASVHAGFSPDGRLVFTSGGSQVHLWDAATGRAIASLPRSETGTVSAAFSPDSRRVLSYGEDGIARIWDVVAGRDSGVTMRHGGAISSGSFSPDGRLVLTSGGNYMARVWDAITGRAIGSPLRTGGSVNESSFSPDGRLVATASQDGQAVIFEIDRGDLAPVVDEPGRAERSAADVAVHLAGSGLGGPTLSPDGSRILGAGPGMARLVETGTGQPIGRPWVQRFGWVAAFAFSPDGRRAAVASHDVSHGGGGSVWSGCQVWDVATGRPVSPLLPHTNWVAALRFSPDGKTLAAGGYNGIVCLWDVETGTMIRRPLVAGSIVLSVAFSPDGRLLAAGTASPVAGTADRMNQAVLWDLDSGERRGEPVRFKGWVHAPVFSPDGAAVAIGSAESFVRIIETASGRVRTALQHGGPVGFYAFSPDSRHILTSGFTPVAAEARIWDAHTGKPVSPVMARPCGPPGSAVVNPAFTAFAVGYPDGPIWLWDLGTMRTIGAARGLRETSRLLSFGRDGRSLLALDHHANLRTWPVPQPAGGTVDALARRMQVRTGQELDSGRTVARLAPDDWRRLREDVGDAPLMPDVTDGQNWHEANAYDAEALGDGFGARWHLDRLIAARPDDGLLHARRARTQLWSGDTAAAGADIQRALALGPRDRILDWLVHRANDFRAEGRPGDALRLFDRVIAARPDDWLTYALRADVLGDLGRKADREADIEQAIARGAEIQYVIRIADERSRAGRWAGAVQVYDRAIALGRLPFEVWMQAVTAHLESDDGPGFGQLCATLRARQPAGIHDLGLAAWLADRATQGPGGVGDDGKVLGWIEPLATRVDPAHKPLKRELLQRLGAVLYRMGRHREAIARLEEAITLGDGNATPVEVIFLAMAQFQVGEPAKARALCGSLSRDEPYGPSTEDWWAWRGRRLLLREAERLVLDPSVPADPFAR